MHLDGSLISATEIEGVDGFRPEEFALAPVRVEEWFNLVFVNLDPQAQPLRESSWRNCLKQAAKFPFAGMKLFERRTYDMKCNWKTYVDNYLEGYHLPSVHPGTESRTRLQRLCCRAISDVMCGSSARFAARSPATQLLAAIRQSREDLTTDYFWIFPNWMLNCYPDNVSLNIVLPVEPERSLAIFEWYLPETRSRTRRGQGVGGIQRPDSNRRRRHLRGRAEESSSRKLLPRALQREAGKRRARLSPDVRAIIWPIP